MMASHSLRIGASFKRHLASYETAATAQRRIADRLAQLIMCHKGGCERVLELGHGTGFLTQHLARLSPKAVWLNDLVAPPPAVAWPEGTKVHHLNADAQSLTMPPDLNLIASSSMLQWVAAPKALIARAFGQLAPGGLLAISSFGPQNFPQLSALGLPAGAPSYQDAAGLVQCLPDTAQVLASFDAEITLQFPKAHAFFAHLRASGVNGEGGGRLTSVALRKLMRDMDDRGALSLTYRPSYCIARRP